MAPSRCTRAPTSASSSRWSGYATNRKLAVEDAIDADPLAAALRELMAVRRSWAGSAAELLRMFADGRPGGPAGIGIESARWPSNPRTLAGRLRRAQTFLRTLGIEIAFSREGHAGHRIIRIRANPGDIVSTVSVTDVAGGAIWK